jgi:two-component system phosphate regulon sensor histidine kinase PhoR
MTERIFKNTFLVGILSFLICAAMFMGVMYQYFEERVFSELKAEAGYVTQGVSASGKSYFDGLASDNRVTWVDTDGTVLYDSVGDAASMENHLGRQEIQEAMKNGAGRSVHYSSVFLEKTLYYAERLPDGTVMRVSCRQNTVGSILLGLLSPMCWMLVLVLILSAILASRLAKRITRPINQIDLEDPRLGDDLKELEPLVSRLREQNCTIKMQLDELGKKAARIYHHNRKHERGLYSHRQQGQYALI